MFLKIFCSENLFKNFSLKKFHEKLVTSCYATQSVKLFEWFEDFLVLKFHVMQQAECYVMFD